MTSARLRRRGDEHDGHPDRRVGHRRLLRWLILAIPATAVFYTGGLTLPGITESADALQRLGGVAIGGALVLELGALLTLAMVYRASLQAVGADLRYPQMLGVSMSAFTVSRIVPGGGAMGAVVAARRMRAEGVPAGVAGTAVVLMGTLAMLTLGTLVTVGALSATLRLGVPAIYAIVTAGLAAVVAAAIAAVLLGLRSERVRHAIFDLAARVLRPFPVDLDGFRRSIDQVADDPPDLVALGRIVAWSVINWGLDIAVVWVLFRGAGEPVTLGVVLVGYGVANLGAALPLTPGGLGVVEAGMAGTYIALGLGAPIAIGVVLVYRLISFWLPTVIGIPVYIRGPAPRAEPGMSVRDRSRDAAAAEPDLAGPTLALQGGMEHQAGCEPIDRAILETLDVDRPQVGLVPIASSHRKRAHTVELATAYWRGLGADLAVVEPGGDPAAVASSHLIVLSGGDPRRLLDGLLTSGLWARIRGAMARGAAVSGSSAGAMVLGGSLPLLRPPAILRLTDGLKLLPGVAVAPHYELPLVRRWAHRVSAREPQLRILGIDERTGLICPRGGVAEVAGTGRVTLLRDGHEERYGPGDAFDVQDLVDLDVVERRQESRR